MYDKNFMYDKTLSKM